MGRDINDTPNRVRYAATASQTAFTIPFPFDAASDIKVWKNGTLLANVTHYSIAGMGGTSGTVTLVTGAALADDILIVRDLPVARVGDFPVSGPFDVASLNTQLDQHIMMIGDLETRIEQRLLRLGTTDAPESLNVIPAKTARSGKLLGFDSNGQPAALESQAVIDAATNASVSASAAASSAGQASASASSALSSATTATTKAAEATASAAAAASLLGAALFATKAAATSGIGAIAANAFVVVAVDESMNNQISLYQKVSGAYVYVRNLADTSTSGLYNRYGYGTVARNTYNTLSMWSDDYIGSNGAGGTDWFPRSITASQSGTTVTASTSVFVKLYVGAVIRWASGTEAVITEINNGPGWSPITTCTVDRSQTVASSSATIVAKHLVGITYGDSVGDRVLPVLEKLMWKSLGFGGYVFSPINVEGNFGGQIASVDYTGGASTVTDTYSTAPWGSIFNVPVSGTATFNLLSLFSGVFRSFRNGLSDLDRANDTAVIVWKRAAGAFTVERKRISDISWEAVATIADASTGSSTYNHLRYSHELRDDWQYRVTSTSGTIKFVAFAYFNNTAPGFVAWPMSRGGDNISNFDGLSSSDLGELCKIMGQPDFRWILSADGLAGILDPASYLPDLATDRALWAAAAPRCDHIWGSMWEAEETGPNEARNEAILQTAILNNDPYVPLYDLFGDYATSGSLRGFIEDGVHPSIRGEVIIGHQLCRVLGLSDHPIVRSGRDVNALRGQFTNLTVDGNAFVDVVSGLQKNARPTHGTKWGYGVSGYLIGAGALAAAIGSGDFTVLLDFDVISPAGAQFLFYANANLGGLATASGLEVYQQGSELRISLKNASNVGYEYRYGLFGTAYGGKRRKLVIRSDRAKNRFDLFVDGKPLTSLGISVNGAGADLATWSGVGQDVGIPQASTIGDSTFYYGVMYWPSRITTSQIREISLRDAPPAGATPDFWWRFAEQGGRVVEDYSGNRRRAVWQQSNPNYYNLVTAPTWTVLTRGLKPLWVASENQTTTLVAGDDVLATMSGDRDMTLPAAPQIGDVVRVSKATTATVRFGQAALHQIKTGAGTTVGTDATTIGTSGKLNINSSYGSATLLCVRADAGVAYEWAVMSSQGALAWV